MAIQHEYSKKHKYFYYSHHTKSHGVQNQINNDDNQIVVFKVVDIVYTKLDLLQFTPAERKKCITLLPQHWT